MFSSPGTDTRFLGGLSCPTESRMLGFSPVLSPIASEHLNSVLVSGSSLWKGHGSRPCRHTEGSPGEKVSVFFGQPVEREIQFENIHPRLAEQAEIPFSGVLLNQFAHGSFRLAAGARHPGNLKLRRRR